MSAWYVSTRRIATREGGREKGGMSEGSSLMAAFAKSIRATAVSAKLRHKSSTLKVGGVVRLRGISESCGGESWLATRMWSAAVRRKRIWDARRVNLVSDGERVARRRGQARACRSQNFIRPCVGDAE